MFVGYGKGQTLEKVVPEDQCFGHGLCQCDLASRLGSLDLMHVLLTLIGQKGPIAVGSEAL